MTPAKEEANRLAAPRLTDEDYRKRFFELYEKVDDAVAWAEMLDNAIERIDEFPSLTRHEMNMACHKLNLVADLLRKAIVDMEKICNPREKEEAA
jgi:hypothetical protein